MIAGRDTDTAVDPLDSTTSSASSLPLLREGFPVEDRGHVVGVHCMMAQRGVPPAVGPRDEVHGRLEDQHAPETFAAKIFLKATHTPQT